jgi:hypothetical protein
MLNFFHSDSKIITIPLGMFGGPMRSGDLLGACNFLEFFRDIRNERILQFYFPPSAVMQRENVLGMLDFIVKHTDYLSTVPGESALNLIPGTQGELTLQGYNLWNIRKDVLYKKQDVFEIEDKVFIKNPYEKQNKLVMVPIFDADCSKNWNLPLLQRLIDYYNAAFPWEKFILTRYEIEGINLKGFKYSFNYSDNLRHVCEAKLYIGGDTGLSHLAGCLTPRSHCEFYYPNDTYGTANPFYWKTKGTMNYYG